MIEKSTASEIAEQLMEKRGKSISEYVLKLPRRPSVKETNKASTQRNAIERNLEN